MRVRATKYSKFSFVGARWGMYIAHCVLHNDCRIQRVSQIIVGMRSVKAKNGCDLVAQVCAGVETYIGMFVVLRVEM